MMMNATQITFACICIKYQNVSSRKRQVLKAGCFRSAALSQYLSNWQPLASFSLDTSRTSTRAVQEKRPGLLEIGILRFG